MDTGTFVRFYRSAQLLQRQFNDLFGTWLLPVHENLFVMGAVFGIYGMVIVEGPVRANYGIITAMIFMHLSFAFKKMGNLLEDSADLVSIARTEFTTRESKWFRKFLASCRSIMVTHGSMFYVDKGLILTILSTIFCNAINLLVTFG